MRQGGGDYTGAGHGDDKCPLSPLSPKVGEGYVGLRISPATASLAPGPWLDLGQLPSQPLVPPEAGPQAQEAEAGLSWEEPV